MKCSELTRKGKKGLGDDKENNAKCIECPKGKVYPTKASAQPSCLCLFWSLTH